jgi:hypothetical protein
MPAIDRFLEAIAREQTDRFRPSRFRVAPNPVAQPELVVFRKRT